jgi:hypothetical protein
MPGQEHGRMIGAPERPIGACPSARRHSVSGVSKPRAAMTRTGTSSHCAFTFYWPLLLAAMPGTPTSATPAHSSALEAAPHRPTC